MNPEKKFIKEQLKNEENQEIISLREAQLKEIDSEEKLEKKIREQKEPRPAKLDSRLRKNSSQQESHKLAREAKRNPWPRVNS